ncbi:unnamed protein product [Urochloa decumbens]|uniref:Meg domain-containing protein n=1 Tax=Urochloa decumbens TaxID=240449 RepID=A0ABC9HB98_9POAL
MEKYTKHTNALVFFSLLLLGSFAIHVQGRGLDEVGTPASTQAGIGITAKAMCAEGRPPCRDNKCWRCLDGRCNGCLYSTFGECSSGCF